MDRSILDGKEVGYASLSWVYQSCCAITRSRLHAYDSKVCAVPIVCINQHFCEVVDLCRSRWCSPCKGAKGLRTTEVGEVVAIGEVEEGAVVVVVTAEEEEEGVTGVVEEVGCHAFFT